MVVWDLGCQHYYSRAVQGPMAERCVSRIFCGAAYSRDYHRPRRVAIWLFQTHLMTSMSRKGTGLNGSFLTRGVLVVGVVPGIPGKPQHGLMQHRLEACTRCQLGHLIHILRGIENVYTNQVGADCRHRRGIESNRNLGVSKGIPDVADDPEVLLRRKTDDLKRRGNDYLARKCAEGTFLQVEALAQLRRLVAEPGVNGAVERIL